MAKLSAFLRLFALVLCLTATFAQEKAKTPKVSHVAVGEFLSAGSVTANSLAIYNITSESFQEYYGPSMSASLQATTVDGNDIYLAYESNNFVTIYHYDGKEYRTVGRPVRGTVNQISKVGDFLYIGGQFSAGFDSDINDFARISLDTATATTYFERLVENGLNQGVQQFYVMNGRFVVLDGLGRVYYAVSGDADWTRNTANLAFSGSFMQDSTIYMWAQQVFINSTLDQVSVATTKDGENFDFPVNVAIPFTPSSVTKVGKTYFAASNTFGGFSLANYTDSTGTWNEYHSFGGSSPRLDNIGDELVIFGNVNSYFKRAYPLDFDDFYFQVRPLSNIVAFNDGDPTPLYNGGVDGQVGKIQVGKDIVVITGSMSLAYNILANGVAGYDSINKKWIGLGKGVDLTRGAPYTAAIVDGKDSSTVYIGGEFDRSNNKTVSAIGVLDTSDMVLQQLGDGLQVAGDRVHAANGMVTAIKPFKKSVFVGGSFTRSGNTALANFALWDTDAKKFVNPAGGVSGAVYVLDVYNNKIVLAGSFNKAGNMPVANIALYDTDKDVFEPVGTGLNGVVIALAVDGGDLIACGSFTSAGGRRAIGIATWNGNAWAPLKCSNDACDYETFCKDIKIMNGDIYWVSPDSERLYRYDGDNVRLVGSDDMTFSNGFRGLVRSAEDSSKLWTFGLNSNAHTSPHNYYGLLNVKTENWEYSAQSGFSAAPTFVAGSSALQASLVMVVAVIAAVLMF